MREGSRGVKEGETTRGKGETQGKPKGRRLIPAAHSKKHGVGEELRGGPGHEGKGTKKNEMG